MSPAAGRRPFTGCVLAGGASTRMGTDKALIEIDGRTLAARAADALLAAGAHEVVVVGGSPEAARSAGVRRVDDRWPGQGPLGGIVTALSTAACDVVVVLSCDLVHPDARAVGAVVDGLAEQGADVAVPVVGGRWQTLHAAWSRPCGDVLAEVFADGGRSVRAGLDRLRVSLLEDLDPAWFADADTPDDLPRRGGAAESPGTAAPRSDGRAPHERTTSG